MDSLTTKEKQAIKTFRYAVEDVLKPEHDDHYLLRWLKARSFNEEKAEIMLRKSLTWRRQMRVNNFFEHYQIPEVFEKYHPGAFLGHDKEGCPVWLLNSGSMDVKGFVDSSSKSDFLRYQIWRFETLLKECRLQSKKLNKYVGKHVYIMDEEYLAVGQVLNKPVLESLLNVFNVFEANYPETLKKCYIINVSKLFFVLYSFIKPLLSEETAEKVKIFGTDGWQEALLQDIDASVLPEHWGGIRTDGTGDPRCPSLVNLGGLVPDSYNVIHRPRLADESNVCSISIPKRDYKDINVHVAERNTLVHWEVETEENDLAIGFFFKSSEDDDLQELFPCTRLETYRTIEYGTHECKKPGNYILRLDNTFSWFSSKMATYRIQQSPMKTSESTRI